MHASIEQLLSLRDGEPVEAALQRHVATCPQCSAERERLELLCQRLRELPDPEPPPLREPLRTPAAARAPRHLRILAAASLAGLTLALVLLLGRAPEPGASGHAGVAEPAQTAAGLDELMLQSRRLEGLLERMPADNRVIDAGTAATVAELEDSIARVDWQLNQVAATANTPPRLQQALWRQRVGLMQSLVAVRYAQASAASF